MGQSSAHQRMEPMNALAIAPRSSDHRKNFDRFQGEGRKFGRPRFLSPPRILASHRCRCWLLCSHMSEGHVLGNQDLVNQHTLQEHILDASHLSTL